MAAGASYCTTCGFPSRPADKFCEQCGTSLAGGAAPSADATPEPTATDVKPRRSNPLLVAALFLAIAGVAVFIGVTVAHHRSAGSTAAGPTPNAFQPDFNTIAPIDTVPPTTAPWIPPSGFSALPDKPNFAYKFIPVSETHCDGLYPCWNVTVIAHQGCDYGIAVTLSVEQPDGTVVDSATDQSYGGTVAGQATLLKPENTSGQTDVVGDLTDIHCEFT